MNEQTTKIKKLQDDLNRKDSRTRAQLEAQLAKENSALQNMQVLPLTVCLAPSDLQCSILTCKPEIS